MKKLALTIGIVLTMGLCASAQSLLQKEEELDFRDSPRATVPVIPSYGQTGDGDATTPLGSGIAVLLGLGAAYVVAKKRKED